MKVSLIISVYKDTTSLKTVLDALLHQTYKNFEIVVSEDGESDEMASFIRTYSSLPLLHLTQPDIGWRKNKALNKAITKSNGQYLIFIDGDCVPHHKFIENHLRYASEKRILAGKRVKLGPVYSTLFKEAKQDLKTLELRVAREKRSVLRDGAKFYEEGFYIDPDGWLGFIPKLRTMSQLKGCNFSCYRDALIAINGFDEDYTLPAIGEDIDLTWRFQGLGYKLFSLRNLAIQYHLHHKEGWSEQSENLAKMKQKMARQEFVCKNGLNKVHHEVNFR